MGQRTASWINFRLILNIVKLDPKLRIFKNSSNFIDKVMLAGLRGVAQSFLHKKLNCFLLHHGQTLCAWKDRDKSLALVTLDLHRHIFM